MGKREFSLVYEERQAHHSAIKDISLEGDKLISCGYD